MADVEQLMLKQYNLSSLDPWEWPAEKDQSDTSEDEGHAAAKRLTNRRSKARFSALERDLSVRSSVPGSQKNSQGIENLVQDDEPDPLGSGSTVVRMLRQRKLSVDEDLRLRNRFLLSSTTFSPTMFISQVHNTATIDSLLQGLDFISKSIEKKSASLKVLVESNFERFVRAKATIDSVYAEMRDDAIRANPDARQQPVQARRAPSHAKQLNGGRTNSTSAHKKNAITKDSEYGVKGVRSSLYEAIVRADEVWGPALGGASKQDTLRSIVELLEHNRDLFDLGSLIRNSVEKKDFDGLIGAFTKAERRAEEARSIMDTTLRSREVIADAQLYLIILTAHMWADVREQIELFKKEVWRKLSSTHIPRLSQVSDGQQEQHVELISVLLELGVEENPIWFWLTSRYDYLKFKITVATETTRLEAEYLRRYQSLRDKPDQATIVRHLQLASDPSRPHSADASDNAQVIEFWEYLTSSLRGLLSTSNGILGEVLNYWTIVQSFMEGQAQKTLPVGIGGRSKKHLGLSSSNISSLRSGALELVANVRSALAVFFLDPPLEDISTLLSPQIRTSQSPHSPRFAMLSPSNKYDFTKHPPPSPKRGSTWEKYAFWSPYASSISSVSYISIWLDLITTSVGEVLSSAIVDQSHNERDQLKGMVGGVRERFIQAICAAWNEDTDYFSKLETWDATDIPGLGTKMPSQFVALELRILKALQKILFMSGASKPSPLMELVGPPSTKLLQIVRSQFITSLYKFLSGMVEIAETRNESDTLSDSDYITAEPMTQLSITSGNTKNPPNMNRRLLLTLINIQKLQEDLVPQMMAHFETILTVKLSDEAGTIRNILTQLETRLFQSYVRPSSDHLKAVIQSGIRSPEWEPTQKRPARASPYVNRVLISMVVIHSEVLTTASSLTSSVIRYLHEQVSYALIGAFKEKSRYSLAALMQATLDVEFLAQTLSNYTTETASEIQSQIYLRLDERTDNDARIRLQSELPEMRNTLKRLRETTRGQFMCFKKPRPQKEKVERGRTEE